MNTKFTKGEWIAKTTGFDGIKFGLVYIEGGGFDISGAPDCEANAHLIAAAPDMYKLLEDFKSFAVRQGWDHVLINDAEKLLKKARGE